MAHDEYNFSSHDKGTLNYEGTFNIHIQRTNFWLSQLNVKEGINVFALLSFYTSIKVLNGLILANYATKEYRASMKQKLEKVKEMMDLKNTAKAVGEEAFQMKAWYELADIWEYQIEQMSTIGLVPAKDVDDIIPTIQEKIEEFTIVPQWKPSPGDFDYKKELGLEEPKEKKNVLEASNDSAKHSLPS